MAAHVRRKAENYRRCFSKSVHTPKKAKFEAGEAESMGKNGDIGPAQEPLGESVFTFSALNLNKSVNDRD